MTIECEIFFTYEVRIYQITRMICLWTGIKSFQVLYEEPDEYFDNNEGVNQVASKVPERNKKAYTVLFYGKCESL